MQKPTSVETFNAAWKVQLAVFSGDMLLVFLREFFLRVALLYRKCTFVTFWVYLLYMSSWWFPICVSSQPMCPWQEWRQHDWHADLGFHFSLYISQGKDVSAAFKNKRVLSHYVLGCVKLVSQSYIYYHILNVFLLDVMTFFSVV